MINRDRIVGNPEENRTEDNADGKYMSFGSRKLDSGGG